MTMLESDTGSVRPFIILSSQRSGSTFLRIWLNQHSKIHGYGEVFLWRYKWADGFRAFCARNIKSRLLLKLGNARLTKALRLDVIPRYLVEDYLDLLYHGNNHPVPWTDVVNRMDAVQPRKHKPVVGFKVMYSTLMQYRSLDRWIMVQRPSVIHLTRNNLLRKYVSMTRMKVTRVAHSEDPLLVKRKVYVDVDKFLEFTKNNTSLIDEYRSSLKGRMPYLELSYEDFFADTAASKKDILDFLGVENEDMPFHKMKKIGSSQLSDDIENWGEVVERLGDTAYAKYLETPECPPASE